MKCDAGYHATDFNHNANWFPHPKSGGKGTHWNDLTTANKVYWTTLLNGTSGSSLDMAWVSGVGMS